ncbi:hypothetical protein H6G41_29785 [Tolypothrix sp. FACHB-123]|uniref:hypothetical protein n=1 Tax=Tolypothrix sp. FACHB-123 TaxID=2692868 RepID=UPI0016840222|nr:hypothetical protein [Tolypothrix sp. FACHB-123]MBD2358738.1 hypothetical protein [Tolypothrix sp. FACHB-123]
MFDDLLKAMGSVSAAGGSIYGYSEEYKKFLSSGYKCFKCNKTLLNRLGFINAKFYSKDGTEIALATVGFRRDVVLECPDCNHRWNMYGKSNPIRPNKLEVVSIIETHRSEEILGIDQRIIDNSKSTSKTTRKFTVSKEWSKSYSIQYENTQVNGTELNLGVKLPEIEIANIKLTSQETLKSQYSISEGKKETYTEEVQVEVSGYKKLKVFFTWKRIWQHGVIKFRHQDNTEFDVPFQVAVEVTFDQSQIDE